MATTKKSSNKKAAVKKSKLNTQKKSNLKKPHKTLLKAKLKVKSTKKSIKAESTLKNKKSSHKKTTTKTASKKITVKSTRPSTKLTLKKSTSTKSAQSNSASVKSKKGVAWLRPLDDRLLIELLDEPQVSPGGIILIDTTQQPENLKGVVLAVGRGHQNKKGRVRPIETKAGDKVIFSKFAGDKVKHNGVNFVIIRESEILGFSDKQ